MARSRKRYSRAQIRARVRRPKRRGGAQWFYGAMALIVIVGVGGIVAARSANQSSDTPPQPGDPATGAAGDHWHAAFAVNICGDWVKAPETFETAAGNANVRVGIHTHGDGFIHIHPFTRSEGGDNATLGKFLGYGGWGASEDSIDFGSDATKWEGLSADPSKRTWSNGDKCPAGTPFAEQTGVVKWSLDCTTEHGNPSDLKLADQTVVALAFLPKHEQIGIPPNASETPQQDQSSTPTPLNAKGCSTAGPGGAVATTLPGATTAPAATDTTTAPTTASSTP
jgi:hypothetical protein